MHFFGLKIDAARALQRQLECGFLLQWSASLCRVAGMCRRLVAPTRTPRDMQISHCHLTSKARARGTSSVGAKPTGLSKHNQELSIVWACSRHSQPESMQQFMHVYNGNFGWQMHNNSTGKEWERGVHGCMGGFTNDHCPDALHTFGRLELSIDKHWSLTGGSQLSAEGGERRLKLVHPSGTGHKPADHFVSCSRRRRRMLISGSELAGPG